MPIDRTKFDAISEQDIQELLEAKVPEGLLTEYKQTVYSKSDSDKRELLKDVSAFANSHGGHIIIGIKENEGVPVEICGLENDTDSEILRMENLLHSGVEPCVPGIRIKPVPIKAGGNIIIIRVPQSWNPPHRVSSQGINRFYIRNSAGVHEPSIGELRALFTQSASALEQSRSFRDERIRLVCAGEGPNLVDGPGRLFIHIIPVAVFSGMVHVDMVRVAANKNFFKPLNNDGLSSRYNYDGYLNEHGNRKQGYTQIFRNGILEATYGNAVIEDKGNKCVDALATEREIFLKLPLYLSGLREISIPIPLIIMISLEGVKNAIYAFEKSNIYNMRYIPPVQQDILKLPECLLEQYGEIIDIHHALRPTFDALWNASNFETAQYFNKDGRWVGDNR